jgi:hypothetical protein
MTIKPHATRARIDDVKSGQAAGNAVAPDGA